jgi:hypothetical protein
MNGKKARYLRKIVGARCVNMPYDSDTYELIQTAHVSGQPVYRLDIKGNSPRKTYKLLKQWYYTDHMPRLDRVVSNG